MTQVTQQAVSRVEAVINRQWAKMVKWQDARGWKWSLFDAEDTVQRASLLLFKWATEGKYDGKTDKEIEQVFISLVRNQGFNQWTACKRDRSEYAPQSPDRGAWNDKLSWDDVDFGDRLSEKTCRSLEDSVDAREVIEQAFGEDLWIAEAMMAGESLNEIGTHRPGVGATTVKKRAKKAAQKALELVAE